MLDVPHCTALAVFQPERSKNIFIAINFEKHNNNNLKIYLKSLRIEA